MTITNFSDVSNLFVRILGEEILLQEDSSTSPQCELDWEKWLLTALVIVSIPLNVLKLYSCLRSYRRLKPQNKTSYSFETECRSQKHSETDMCEGLAYSKSEPV
ncbi:hypothetical protein Bpfe_020563 [Biomphalaria pfeifferi]|uniref:Uncharacterized protein n=1 Tax=Biomphalaria pfeifferi TaxID=112525 RepID=A0AAD8F363_BIOPF|nr:hypothetical protein Bpfe_020563 [Biomphalaria pfeifferi]